MHFPFPGPSSQEFFRREEAVTSQPENCDTLVSVQTGREWWEINVSALELLIRSPVNIVMSP